MQSLWLINTKIRVVSQHNCTIYIHYLDKYNNLYYHSIMPTYEDDLKRYMSNFDLQVQFLVEILGAVAVVDMLQDLLKQHKANIKECNQVAKYYIKYFNNHSGMIPDKRHSRFMGFYAEVRVTKCRIVLN